MKPASFATETCNRGDWDETTETKTHKNESQDESCDWGEVSRLHPGIYYANYLRRS